MYIVRLSEKEMVEIDADTFETDDECEYIFFINSRRRERIAAFNLKKIIGFSKMDGD